MAMAGFPEYEAHIVQCLETNVSEIVPWGIGKGLCIGEGGLNLRGPKAD